MPRSAHLMPGVRSNALVAGALVAAMVLTWVGMSSAARAQPDLSPRDIAVIRINVIDLLAHEPGLPLPVKQRREALRAYYEGHGGPLLWLDGNRASQLIARLTDAASDGLDANDYPTGQLASLLKVAGTTDERSLAVIELFFSAALLEYTSDLSVGRFLPSKIDPDFFLKGRTLDEAAALEDASRRRDLGEFFAAWSPANPQYVALHAALARYRALAARGGWDGVPLGDTLRPGMSDPRVGRMRARLALTDGANPRPAGNADTYDPQLVEAVKRFQARNGLDVDGLAGRSTLIAMNVPVEDRIASIALTMERWRWMPANLGRQYVIVNIAGFELRRVRAGTVAERMRVVVGKPYSRTPVFSDRIRYVEFNPYWNVPGDIAIKEELPSLKTNPANLAAQGFEAVSGDQVYDLRSVDWARYGPGNFPFRLRQRPGPNNALGRVKIMFPNPHDVYLHDTPSRGLFARSERAFSHGCIRLARPLELADQVLRVGGVSGWNPQRIDAVVASQKNTIVNLNDPIPVYITYQTAWSDNGVVSFRRDIYEHDAKLLAALDGKSLAW